MAGEGVFGNYKLYNDIYNSRTVTSWSLEGRVCGASDMRMGMVRDADGVGQMKVG